MKKIIAGVIILLAAPYIIPLIIALGTTIIIVLGVYAVRILATCATLFILYLLIKGLMKYHHDLKSGNQDSQVLSDNGEQV